MTEEKTIIEKRDATGFENAEGIKLSVSRNRNLRHARFCSRQKWLKSSSEFQRKIGWASTFSTPKTKNPKINEKINPN
jgi:hypothetical protein